MLVLHLGGEDSLSHLSGIHGHHLANYEYIATDSTDQTIISVSEPNPDGSTTEFVSSDWKGPIQGVNRRMDCMDCHNQATHTFQTPQDAIDNAMLDGSPSANASLCSQGRARSSSNRLRSQDEAGHKITSGLEDFYRTQYPDS